MRCYGAQALQRHGKLRRPMNEDGEGVDVDMEACFVGGVEYGVERRE